jgi:CheY-like chemotaxis protein
VNILIVEDDQHLCRILATVLGNEGHSVATVSDPTMAAALVASTVPEVVVVNAETGAGDGMRLAARLREDGNAAVVLTTAYPSEDLRRSALAIGADLFPKPFSVLDLAQHVRSFAARAKPPPVEVAEPSLDVDNVNQIVRLWARRANGVLNVSRPPFAAWVMLSGGGPVDGDGMDALRYALTGGDLEFQPCDVEGRGEHRELGRVLWERVRERIGREAVPRDGVLAENRLTAAIGDLPVPQRLTALVQQIRGSRALGELLDTTGATDEVVPEVMALVELGLLSFTTPKMRPESRLVFRLPSDAPRTPDKPAGHSPADRVALRRRMERELQVLRDADPWVVLGIPRDADPALIQRAGERMANRYETLHQDSDGAVASLAGQLLARVRAALAELESAGDPLSVSAEPVPAASGPDEPAFRAGLRAMSSGDWPAADRLFTTARDLCLDSPRNLAHLGWARFHNPELPNQERTVEGTELLQLAEQFDPLYAEGQYFLAAVLHRGGDEEGALRRLRRALKAEPGHVASIALARKICRSTN